MQFHINISTSTQLTLLVQIQQWKHIIFSPWQVCYFICTIPPIIPCPLYLFWITLNVGWGIYLKMRLIKETFTSEKVWYFQIRHLFATKRLYLRINIKAFDNFWKSKKMLTLYFWICKSIHIPNVLFNTLYTKIKCKLYKIPLEQNKCYKNAFFFPFSFRSVFMKVYFLVQQKPWTL